jgi:CxxC-x17-CxxC domain-containing protein
MSIAEKTLVCQDCSREFVFTVGEQEFYQEKGFENEPKRCPDCRREKKQTRGRGRGESKPLFTVTCSECGIETQVPFEPRDGRPVYCRDCFETHRK